MKKIILFITGLTMLMLLSGCGAEKAESKNMEQIYKEEGVPVKTEVVTLQKFEKKLSFNAELSGIKESSEYASFGDKVEKIYVKVGDYVKKDQLLISFPEDNPSAQYYQAKVAFKNAENAYKRIENLYASGGVSKQDKDNVQTQYEVAKANWNAVSKMIKVKAPISGYVTKINVRETENVDKEAELITISQTHQLKCKVWVTDSEITNVKLGENAGAVWNDRKITGKVVQVDMAINKMNQAFGVMLEFDNPDNLIKLGVTADISIISYENEQAVVVKQKNLFNENNHTFVFVEENGKSVKRSIKTGLRQGLDVEVISGITAGENLIVEGQMMLYDGTKVKIIK